jgi:hypothetical protein
LPRQSLLACLAPLLRQFRRLGFNLGVSFRLILVSILVIFRKGRKKTQALTSAA